MNVLLRGFWFVLIGWWLGALWFGVSILLMVSLVFLPLGWNMAKKTGAVMFGSPNRKR